MVRPGVQTRKPRVSACCQAGAHRVDRLPRDQHRYDGRLAGTGGELQREPHELRVGVAVGGGQMVQEALPRLRLRRDLGQPDRRLDRLDLTEERPNAGERVVSPVLEQARRLRHHLPLVRVRQRPPGVHMAANLVDDRRWVVLLRGRREPLALVEHHLALRGLLALLRLRDRGDEVSASARLADLLRGLAGLVQLPVTPRDLIGGVQDGLVEERVRHRFVGLLRPDDGTPKGLLGPGRHPSAVS